MEPDTSHDVSIRQISPAGAAKGKGNRRAPRSQVFRVTGLPLNDSDEVERNLRVIIEHNMADDEGQVKINIIPSCDGEGLNALVEFDHGVPEFLDEIKRSPLESHELEMGENDISFDAHFHGFTQLYTSKNPISMEYVQQFVSVRANKKQHHRDYGPCWACLWELARTRKSRANVVAQLPVKRPSELSNHDLRVQLKTLNTWRWNDIGLRERVSRRAEAYQEIGRGDIHIMTLIAI